MNEKKSTFIATLIITSCVCLMPIVLGFILWNKLPEMLPQQYGWDDQVNWSLPKPAGFILCPAILVLVNVVIQSVLRLSKQQLNKKVVLLISWLIPVLTLVVNSLMLLKATGLGISAIHIVIPVLSLMFIIIGNYLPKTEPNGVVGVRAPWINGNPDVWAKTNRLGGILMVITGFVCLVTSFTPIGKYVFVISLIVLMVITLIYSLILAARSR